jgi:hypothetical protein
MVEFREMAFVSMVDQERIEENIMAELAAAKK